MLIKDPNSIRINDFLMNTSRKVILYSNMLNFRDCNKPFTLDGDLFKTMTNYNSNIAHFNSQNQNLNYELGKEMKFNIKQKGRKIQGMSRLKKLPKSPAVTASGILTIFFHLILMSFVIEQNYYYKRKKLDIVLT